jgi:hypothetical protein
MTLVNAAVHILMVVNYSLSILKGVYVVRCCYAPTWVPRGDIA